MEIVRPSRKMRNVAITVSIAYLAAPTVVYYGVIGIDKLAGGGRYSAELCRRPLSKETRNLIDDFNILTYVY